MGKYLKVLMIIYILFCVQELRAQKQTCTFTGRMTIKGGESLPYKLLLDINGNLIKGTSVTTQDGKELKAKIKGIVNREKNIMVLSETGPVGKLSDSVEICFFNSILKWKVKRGVFVLSGAFLGKDKKNNPCSQGTVSLEAPEASCAVLKEEQIISKKDSLEVAPVVTDGQKITEGTDKKIEWEGNICLLEIWDGGIEDGDVVNILVNGKELVNEYALTTEKKRITIPLIQQTNTITVVAGAEGTNPPNTVQMILTDGDTQHRVTAYNKKGKSASIIIIKK